MDSADKMAGFRFPRLHRTDGQVSVQQLTEQQYQQGYADGSAAAAEQAYQRGLLDGKLQAQTQAANELALRLSQLGQQHQQALDLLATQFNQQLLAQDEQLALELTTLVQRLAEVVLQTELQLQPGLLLQIVGRLAGTLTSGEPLQSIVLAQADAPLFSGVQQIGEIPLRFEANQPAGQILFQARQQLHQLDFNSRLAEAMRPVAQELLATSAPEGSVDAKTL